MKSKNLNILIIPSDVPTFERSFVENYLATSLPLDVNICVGNTDMKEVIITDMGPDQFISLINYIKNIGIPVSNYDITKMILSGLFDDNVFSVVNDSEENKIFIENFISDNLTIDDVLDKINKSGIDSLTDFEKKVLLS